MYLGFRVETQLVNSDTTCCVLFAQLLRVAGFRTYDV